MSPSLLVAPKGGREVASSRYRVHDLVPLLERRGWTIEQLTPSTHRSRRLRNARRDLARAARAHDVLLVQRPGRRREELPILRLAARRAKIVAIDVDDPMDEHGAAGWAVAAASVAFAGNEALASHYRGRVGDVHVLPTGLDTSLYERERTRRGRLVGWIGHGPAYRDPLVAMVRGVALAGAPWRLQIVGTLGDTDLERRLREAALGVELELVPAVDWEREPAVADVVATFDVGLAPFRDHHGTSFKTVQYLAAGAIPLVEAGGAGEAHARAALGADAPVVTARDAEAVAAALAALDDDAKLEALAQRGVAAARRLFSREGAADRIDMALRRALDAA